MKFKYLFLISLFIFAISGKAQTYASSNFSLISVISPETYTNSYGAKYSGCWGWYQANKNKEYAIAGSASGTFWVDVTNPATPTVSAYRAGKKTNTVWREIKTYQNYCYVVTDDGGPASFQIFDMQYLPDSVHKVLDNQVLFKRGHAAWVDGSKLYVSGVTYSNNTTSSMNVYSLATPSVPVLLRELKQDASFISYVHDMMPVNDTIFASCGNQGLYVFKQNTNNTFTQLGSLTTYSGSGFNHSSALTPNRQTLVFTDEVPAGKPIKVANVSNLSNIQVLAVTNQFPQTTPHNPFMVSNSLCFMSSYQDGLQLYNISNPSTPSLVAYFDTYYQGGGNNNNWAGDDYDGQWGAYPYFPSKNIFALDQMNGIFMLKTHLYQNAANSPTVSFIGPGFTCPGSAVTYSNLTSGATSYTWSFPGGSPASSNAANPTVVYNSSGTFNTTLNASNTTTTSNFSSNVTVIQLQGTTTFTNATCSTCNNGKASVVASGGGAPYTYTWSPSGGNAALAQNLLPGCYTVTIKNAYNCVTSKTVCVGFATGIQNVVMNEKDFIVYPNPASSEIKLKVSSDIITSIAEIQLVDYQGKIINKQPAKALYNDSSEEFILPTQNISNGIYLLKILNTNQETVSKKINVLNN